MVLAHLGQFIRKTNIIFIDSVFNKLENYCFTRNVHTNHRFSLILYKLKYTQPSPHLSKIVKFINFL